MRKHRTFLVSGLVAAAVACAGCGGGGQTAEPLAQEPQSHQISAPIDVKVLPYFSESWTFTRTGDTIEVQTDMYRDDEGRGFGLNVCNQVWGTYPYKDVMVLAADGGPLAHRFANGSPYGPCERG